MSPSVTNADPPRGNGWGRTKIRNRDYDIFYDCGGNPQMGMRWRWKLQIKWRRQGERAAPRDITEQVDSQGKRGGYGGDYGVKRLHRGG